MTDTVLSAAVIAYVGVPGRLDAESQRTESSSKPAPRRRWRCCQR
jgi:hypothetical protein